MNFIHKMSAHNLNHQVPLIADIEEEWPTVQTSIIGDKVDVHFHDLEQRCKEYIQNSDFVVGCVAWLTHKGILETLALKECLLVVQKEDFLRPDTGNMPHLRQLYDNLNPLPWHKYSGERIRYLSELNRMTIFDEEAIRCMGNYNKDKVPAFPRMHHKFLIFGRKVQISPAYYEYVPTSVWTGSFNLTHNATNSRENAVVLYQPEIVDAYYKEFCNIFAVSEPLDWTTEWMAPEFRIGT